MERTAPDAATAQQPGEEALVAALAAKLAARARVAGEVAELATSLARLATSEARLSASSLLGAFGWRAVAVLAAVPAWVLLVVAAVVALADAFGSLAVACVVVAAVHAAIAALALWRAQRLAARAGFARTRTALAELAAAEPQP